MVTLKTSESIKNISAALLNAQKQMGAAKKDSANPFFKSKYADLGAVMEVTKEPININGVLILQPATHKEGRNFITTRIIHVDSGEWMESDTEVICSKPNDPQAKLAAETYTRRGSLQAFLFIPAEDDDGNFASGKTSSYANNNVLKNTVAPVNPEVASALKKSSFRKAAPPAAGATDAASLAMNGQAMGGQEEWT